MNWKFWQSTDEASFDGASLGRAGKAAVGVFGGDRLLCAGLMWWWDNEPAMFAVRESAATRAEANNEKLVTGYIATATLIRLAESLLDKRGGYLSNDVFPPGVWMDNVPNWEFGVLTQVRDTARAYRIDFSRSQSQSTEDPDLKEAEGKFFFDSESWVFPETEDQYRDGIALVESYLERLADPSKPNAQFYARAMSAPRRGR